jgi:DNA (cytosine-5)-methyltransferase 1
MSGTGAARQKGSVYSATRRIPATPPQQRTEPMPPKRSSGGQRRATSRSPKRAARSTELLEYARPLRFIDLFCGIGGFRLGFERAGAECVFSCDWDKHSRTTYAANFGETPFGDINQLNISDIPVFDILCAGFPCQPFSIAGVSKKQSLGLKHGFDDARQGNLFFSLADIIEHHRPPAFVLENVKHLQRHDKGRTFQVISQTLTGRLGYHLHTQVIDARSVVPQHRERIFLVGFREDIPFEFPAFPTKGPKLGSILEKRPPEKYTLTDHLWTYLQNYAEKHRAAGNGFGFGLCDRRNVTRTLSARYHKDGSEILVSQGAGKNPRRLTPRECARLMGYPDDFQIPVSDTQAYRQFGNSVVVPVVERIATAVVNSLEKAGNSPSTRVIPRRAAARTG